MTGTWPEVAMTFAEKGAEVRVVLDNGHIFEGNVVDHPNHAFLHLIKVSPSKTKTVRHVIVWDNIVAMTGTT